MIDANNILKSMNHKIDVYTYNTIPSTNDEARQFLLKTLCERAVFVARGQTAGKGRLGRKFYSPTDTGIYMTYVFRVEKLFIEAVRITTAASVAVAKALNCGCKSTQLRCKD